MESLFGFVGKDYVLIAADATAGRSILFFKHDEDKIKPLDSHKLLGTVGDPADRVNFTEYIQKNIKLHELRHGLKFSSHAAANFTRNELATALRKGPYQVFLLLGGFDQPTEADKGGPSLYYMDYLASMVKTNFGAHGYGSYFIQSIFDRYWKTDLSLEEGKKLARLCVEEIQLRFMVNQRTFIFKVIDKDGIHEISL